ncbi:MAG: glycosyltransferase [candidate division WOR-3 bacterium]
MYRIIIVIATYGLRSLYVKRLFESLFQPSIKKTIIVVNKMPAGHREYLSQITSEKNRVRIITNSENLGSAIGFGMGIKEALSDPECDFIWLMDDDTMPEKSTLQTLLEKWEKLSADYGANNFALVCFRPDQQPEIARGLSTYGYYLRPGCFFSFHFLNMPSRLLRSVLSARSKSAEYPETIRVPYAPYGGFFAHRSVYEKIGLPNSDFVLYKDDLEYTLRLTRAGGYIFLCPSARINSQEIAWDNLRRFPFGILPWLDSKEEFRIYYGARNTAYFEKNYYDQKVYRTINRSIYLTLLFLLSLFMKKKGRFRLIIKAIKEGELGKLGYNNYFPLP